MNLELLRFSSSANSTLGLLFKISDIRAFLCYTLEDEHRTRKIKGETRIPAGRYEITLRKEGGMNSRYSQKIKDHKGMLWLRNVPNFKYIYIHIGNNDNDTSGCILVGDESRQNIDQSGMIRSSMHAYKRVYSEIANHIESGKQCFINIINYDGKLV